MTFEDIDVNVLLKAVQITAAKRTQFRTKDISTCPPMEAAHAAVRNEEQYHSVVGKLLRRHAAKFGIRLLGVGRTQDGQLWEVVGA